MCLLTVPGAGIAIPQEEDTSTSNDQTKPSSEITNFWTLTEKAQEFRWPLFLVFFIGMIIVIKKAVDLAIDWNNARVIYHENFTRFKRKEQIENYARQHKCVASDLIRLLMQTLKVSPDAAKFTEEVEKFRDAQKQHFETFQSRMGFWSDTAGALGLLGTVWGMFRTFFRGDMDQQHILSGMGIALITTLMGLIISVILNLFATEVSGFFNKILNKLSEVANMLWLRIIEIQPPPARHFIQGSTSTAIASDAPVTLGKIEKRSVEPKKRKSGNGDDREEKGVQYQLVSVSGHTQKVTVNHKSKQPFVVELLKVNNSLKQKVAGEDVTFTVTGKMGTFENGKNEVVKTTDASGRAEVYFTPAKQNGDWQITAQSKALPVETVQFTVNVVTLKPTDFKIKSGNNQSGPVGRKLPEPIVLEVVDEENTPVSNCTVQLKVVMGNGYFSNNKPAIEVCTDENGEAVITFTLGDEGGFNAVQGEVVELVGRRLSIQALGQ